MAFASDSKISSKSSGRDWSGSAVGECSPEYKAYGYGYYYWWYYAVPTSNCRTHREY